MQMAQGLGSNSQPQGRELKEMGICLSFAWCWSNDVENEAKKKAAEEPKSKRPSNTQWGQQTLPACKPVRTKLTVVGFHLIVALICVPLGIVCLFYGRNASEISVRYDNICPNQLPGASNSARLQWQWNNSGTAGNLCRVNVTLDRDMNGPIYMYYQIVGMYQNHRRYVRSHLDQQMASDNTNGNWKSLVNDATQAQSCVPLVNYLNNASLQINPCGLVAWSFFNDTYELRYQATANSTFTAVSVADSVSFPQDTQFRFADYYPSYFNPALNSFRGGGNLTTPQGVNQTLKEAQRFQVWMRLSQLPNFRKLWGKIGGNYRKGSVLQVDVMNNYNSYQFDGQKLLVLSTTSWIGGNSLFLGAAYLGVGALNILFALAYLVIIVAFPRPFGDVSKLLPQAHFLKAPSTADAL